MKYYGPYKIAALVLSMAAISSAFRVWLLRWRARQ